MRWERGHSSVLLRIPGPERKVERGPRGAQESFPLTTSPFTTYLLPERGPFLLVRYPCLAPTAPGNERAS